MEDAEERRRFDSRVLQRDWRGQKRSQGLDAQQQKHFGQER